MKALEIKKGVYWVGAIDWDLRNFHGYLTRRGSTYNAYLIVDEKIALVDTVKHYLFEEMLARISSVVDPSKIDYIITNHVEMDHSGSLPAMLGLAKKAVVVASPNGEKGLAKHYRTNMNIKTVNTGDSIGIGKRNLKFILTPMVHWPDSMATYLPEEKMLLPNDAFGQHMATAERFADEIGWDIVSEEAAKYYANIVMPFGRQVNEALKALSGLEIDMIAPSHGVIWRDRLKDIMALYRKWADNVCDNKAVIVYDTMWGSTRKIAYAINTAFDEMGIPAMLADLGVTHISDAMAHVLGSKYIFIGSPTLNNGMLPTVAAFLAYMKGLAPKNRTGLAFGSYGWGGQSVGEIEAVMKNCGFEVMESIKVQYVPDVENLNAIKDKIKSAIRKGGAQ